MSDGDRMDVVLPRLVSITNVCINQDPMTGAPVCTMMTTTGKDEEKGGGGFELLAEELAGVDNPKERFHLQMIAADPGIAREFEALLNRLTPVSYYLDSISTRDVADPTLVNSMIRKDKDKFNLPLFTADHMQQMVREAGVFDNYVWPACKFESTCVGNTTGWVNAYEAGKPGGFTLMAFMWPEEYEEFKKYKVPPTEKRPCVLCLCSSLARFTMFARANAFLNPGELDRGGGGGFEDFKIPTFQVFRCLVDQEGGFYKTYTLSDPKNNDIFIVPLPKVNKSSTPLRIESVNRRAYMDLSVIRWKPSRIPISPNMGEKEKDFHRGVRNGGTTSDSGTKAK